MLICAVLLFRKNMMARRADASETEVSNGADSTTASQTRELTAADLTGGTRAARRQRRPRRTPSQISTRSLPAYMKEPGDNEVVIYRYAPRLSRILDISHMVIRGQRSGRHG